MGERRGPSPEEVGLSKETVEGGEFTVGDRAQLNAAGLEALGSRFETDDGGQAEITIQEGGTENLVKALVDGKTWKVETFIEKKHLEPAS